VFLDRGERDKNNEIGLKEEGGIEMSTTVLPLRDARSIRFMYLPFRSTSHDQDTFNSS